LLPSNSANWFPVYLYQNSNNRSSERWKNNELSLLSFYTEYCLEPSFEDGRMHLYISKSTEVHQ